MQSIVNSLVFMKKTPYAFSKYNEELLRIEMKRLQHHVKSNCNVYI